MNADNFRKLYQYHFTLNRRIWDRCITKLTDEQFTRELPYSIGSIRNQTVHMASIDERWFSGLGGTELPNFLDPTVFPNRTAVRAKWDAVENEMQACLDGLTDQRIQEAFSGDMLVWEVLFHVLNHGTDHRAQVLSMLNQQHGVKTFPQDYVFFIWDKLP
jgi:uncharacterized damage-inducible protein DinB